ncbi:MAG: hypothetical protein AAFO81_15365, partial [Pseudomonadota bacterium]
MTIRPFDFAEGAPSLERVVERAETLSGLCFRVEKDIDSIHVEFTEIDGSVNISREHFIVTMHGPWTYAPVLLDLFDVAIRDLGGVQESVPPKDLPLPLTKEFVFQETTKSRVRARRAVYLFALGLAVMLVALV